MSDLIGIEYQEIDSQIKKKRAIVDRELLRIYRRDGNVTPEAVLKEARSPKNPLNVFFTWDDSVAAEKWRRTEASVMIIASKVVAVMQKENESVKVDTAKVRRLVSAYRGEGFVLRKDALEDGEQRERVIKAKKAMLRSWCVGVADISELQPLRELILQNL